MMLSNFFKYLLPIPILIILILLDKLYLQKFKNLQVSFGEYVEELELREGEEDLPQENSTFNSTSREASTPKPDYVKSEIEILAEAIHKYAPKKPKNKVTLYLKGFNDAQHAKGISLETEFSYVIDKFCPEYKNKVEFFEDDARRPAHFADAFIISYRFAPKEKPPAHRTKPYVLFTMEAPHITLSVMENSLGGHGGDDEEKENILDPNSEARNKINKNYNYLMSWSSDADFFNPYNQKMKVLKPLLFPEDEGTTKEDFLDLPVTYNKPKLVVSFVSNCVIVDPYRLAYLKALKDSLKDQFQFLGYCGSDSHQKGHHAKMTNDTKIDLNFKFFLAFENSRCDDYITEKLWLKSFAKNVVPVVAGPSRSNYENLFNLPKKSFIHVDDFKTPKELADYLVFLNDPKNDEKYRAVVNRCAIKMTKSSKTSILRF